MYCVLVFDKDDVDNLGAEFGQLVASHILSRFVDEFGDEVSGAVGHNLKVFQGFQYRLQAIVREVAHQVLTFCTCPCTASSTAPSTLSSTVRVRLRFAPVCVESRSFCVTGMVRCTVVSGRSQHP